MRISDWSSYVCSSDLALPGDKPPALELRVAARDVDPVAVAQEKGADTYAVMSGPLAAPRIVEREEGSRSGAYLALLATDVLCTRAAGEIGVASCRERVMQYDWISVVDGSL